MNAKMENARVSDAAGALIVMRSVEPGPNPQVLVNQPVPNFPRTPDDVSQMTGNSPLLVLLFSKLTNVLRRAPMSQRPYIP